MKEVEYVVDGAILTCTRGYFIQPPIAHLIDEGCNNASKPATETPSE